MIDTRLLFALVTGPVGVAGLVGYRLGRRFGRREGFALRFCPNCLQIVKREGFVSQ